MDESNLYTPQELVDEFPGLAKAKWTATRLGILFNMGLLKGRRVNRQALITLQSLIKLVDFHNSNNDDQIDL